MREIDVSGLSAWFGSKQVLRDINLGIEQGAATAIIGPSGCGKSTLIRCLNRMHEEVRSARVEGKVLFDGEDIYDQRVDPVVIRRRIGMVFQKPNPFPTMSILENTVAGLKLLGRLPKTDLQEQGEKALRGSRPLGGGQGPPGRFRRPSVWRPAAAVVYRASPRRRTRGAADG